jgi:hypothetical protein
MKKFILFTLLILFSFSSFAEERMIDFLVSGSFVYTETSYADQDSMPFIIVNDPLYLGTIGVSLFPESWDLSLTYTGAIQGNFFSEDKPENPRSHTTEDVNYTQISLNLFNTILGGLSISYEDYRHNTTYKNDSSEVKYIYDFSNDGHNPIDHPTYDPSQGDRALAVSPGEEITIPVEKQEYYLTYHFPFLGLVYARGEGRGYRARFCGTNGMDARSKYGNVILIKQGIEKSIDDIEGFSLKRLLFFELRGGKEYYSCGMENLQEEGDLSQEGEIIEIAYKTKEKTYFTLLYSTYREPWGPESMEQTTETYVLSIGFRF